MVAARKTMNSLWKRRYELDDLAARMKHAGNTEHAQLLEAEAHKLGMVLQIEGILQDAGEQLGAA